MMIGFREIKRMAGILPIMRTIGLPNSYHNFSQDRPQKTKPFPITRPPTALSLIQSKLSESSKAQKLEYLNSLLSTNQKEKLDKYFEHLNTSNLSIDQIYFYLSHRELFEEINQQTRWSLIDNHNLDVYTKFVLAGEIDALGNGSMQESLVKQFNEMCRSLPETQLAYCLNKINEFSESAKQGLNQLAIEQAILEFDYEQNQLPYLQTMHFLINYNKINITQFANILNIKQAKQLVLRPETPIKYLYFLKCYQVKFKIGATYEEEGKRQKKVLVHLERESSQYAVKFLQFYSYLTFSIKIDNFTPKIYQEYLDFLQSKALEDRRFIVMRQELPYKVLLNRNIEGKLTLRYMDFCRIMEMRLSLQLQEKSDLGRHIKKLITPCFSMVYYLIRFLDAYQIYENQVWMDIEEGIIAKLHQNQPLKKRKQVSKIFQQYDIIGFFKLLGTMSMSRFGSFTFWKKMNRLIYEIFEMPDLLKSISGKDQNRFVIYCFQLFRSNNMPEKVEEKMIDLALVAISNNRWGLKELYTLIQCLTYNKFGVDDLWYALENKVMLLNLHQITEQQLQERVRRIVNCFVIMKKGSYKFMNKMSRLQYLKQQQEKQAEAQEKSSLKKAKHL